MKRQTQLLPSLSLTSSEQDGLRRFLLDWYDQNARPLPWRENRDPYRIWVSEIMLQQTRIETVIDYFQRFVCALPNLRSLAECDPDRLLKLWEGLGYYSRAKNLQKTAKILVSEHGGRFPESAAALQKLPGIGAYTAGAIASLAFNERVEAVDGNVLRILSRLLNSRADIASGPARREFEKIARQLVDPFRPGDFNEALMELGERICIANGTIRCEECPIRSVCAAHFHKTAETLPVRSAKPTRKIVRRTLFIVTDSKRVLLTRRPNEGLLAGLYEFPGTDGYLTGPKADQWLFERFGLRGKRLLLPESRSVFSHLEWHMKAYRYEIESLPESSDENCPTPSMEELFNRYALPGAFSPYLSSLKNSAEERMNLS